jgi:outer membrane protein OmpA-like peptidoglycan-associated protein
MKFLVFFVLFCSVALAQNPQEFYCKVRLPESINSYRSTLIPVLSPDGNTLYFDRKQHPENTGGIEDPDEIWYSKRLPGGLWSEPKNIGPGLNTKGSDALFSIAGNGNQALVASMLQSGKLEFYMASHIDSQWKKQNPVRIRNFYNNSPYYFASLNPEGNVLLFALNRDSSMGDLDLYASFLSKGDSIWSEPLWLGKEINSAGREGSPYLANDGKSLYYFSNGLGGYGGNDIFISRRLDDTWQKWSKPQNLGPIINTAGNERSISLTNKGDTACIISTDSLHESEGIYFVCLSREIRPMAPAQIKAPVKQSAASNMPINQQFTADLYFEHGKFSVTPTHIQMLEDLCKLSRDGNQHALIEGYTDDTGSELRNAKLSKQRAAAVAAILKKCGCKSMDILGKGIDPQVQNTAKVDAETRAKARRVSIKLITIQ